MTEITTLHGGHIRVSGLDHDYHRTARYLKKKGFKDIEVGDNHLLVKKNGELPAEFRHKLQTVLRTMPKKQSRRERLLAMFKFFKLKW